MITLKIVLKKNYCPMGHITFVYVLQRIENLDIIKLFSMQN